MSIYISMSKRYNVYLYLLCLYIYLCLKDIVLLNIYLLVIDIISMSKRYNLSY